MFNATLHTLRSDLSAAHRLYSHITAHEVGMQTCFCACHRSQGSIKPVHVSIDHDLEQPTAADAAREEEEYGLNTPAPGKGENNSSSNSGNSSGSNCWSGGSSSSSSSS
jgi:hypothetical protein